MTKVICPLFLRYLDGHLWGLADDFIVSSHTLGIILVPKGFTTDFTSVPRGLRCLLPPDESAPAAVIHDFLYKQGHLARVPITRAQADRVYREFLQLYGQSRWQCWALYAGLRLGGGRTWNHYRAIDSLLTHR